MTRMPLHRLSIRFPRALPLALMLALAAPAQAQAQAQTQTQTQTQAPTRPVSAAEQARWRATAARVTITRDEWGIAHVVGKTDADAVFGAIYAQAEDDFGRIEANYLTALGRTAEADGEAAIWSDLRQRLYVDPTELQALYGKSPPWLRVLMTAWADGLNHYLATHPQTQPKVLTRFEPWMALSFTEGSIGGDIETISTAGLARFYGATEIAAPIEEASLALHEPRGSNGIAIAPKNTVDGHALLLINPHTSFYFRSELHLRSDEGLNTYGASTWGQFFIYQGFNAHAGWMHTSSGIDNIDEFAETVVQRGSQWYYQYGQTLRPVTPKPVTIAYRKPDGTLGRRRFTTWHTHHGPVVEARGGQWISTALMWKPIPALEQSWLRTRTRDLKSFLDVAARRANSSNDTIFADDTGEVAYLHPQFVPIRDDGYDYSRPVDGSNPATDWRGLHAIGSLPNAIRPAIGWVRNTNDQPWSAAGVDSPKAADYPRYMDRFGENARGLHADALLTGTRDFTPERLIATAYDSHQPGFARLMPLLVAAYDALPKDDAQRVALAEPIKMLRDWDHRWATDSVAQSLAVFWADGLRQDIDIQTRLRGRNLVDALATEVTPAEKLEGLASAVTILKRDFGQWATPWGEINRFQRLSNAIKATFDDKQPSLPVPFASGHWGSLASYGAQRENGTKRYYGSNGNSFVAVVEFGPKLRAWAVTAGGESGDPASPHFNDQAERYAAGALRPVHFEAADIAQHAVRVYHPGR